MNKKFKFLTIVAFVLAIAVVGGVVLYNIMKNQKSEFKTTKTHTAEILGKLCQDGAMPGVKVYKDGEGNIGAYSYQVPPPPVMDGTAVFLDIYGEQIASFSLFGSTGDAEKEKNSKIINDVAEQFPIVVDFECP